MSTRRAHPKTKFGCADCKRRRIKCDEGRPSCENCRKRSIPCSFHVFDPAHQAKTSSSPQLAHDKEVPLIHIFSAHLEKDPGNASEIGGPWREEVQDALLADFPVEQRPNMKMILNHFVRETISTISPGTAAQKAWYEALPPLAARNKYVLNGILAVGYLHASTLADTASAREDYRDIAATQMNTGMSQYRTELQSVTTKNAESLFAFQTMITTFVFFTSGVECKETLASTHGQIESDEQRRQVCTALVLSVCRTFRSMRGVLVILVPCYHFLRSGIFEPVLERDWWPAPIPVTAEEMEQDKKLRLLETMWAQPGISYEYSFDTLRSAHKDLRSSFALLSRLTDCTFPGDTPSEKTFDWTAVLHWPVQLGLEFMTMLDQRRMEAWVLMAHFAILPNKARFSPWLDGFAANMITTSALVIGEENWKWIEWPAEVVGVDLESLRLMDTKR